MGTHLTPDRRHFQVRNFMAATVPTPLAGNSGLDLENLRRLQLLYPQCYQLCIERYATPYEADLQLTLTETMTRPLRCLVTDDELSARKGL